MNDFLRGTIVSREQLTASLTSIEQSHLSDFTLQGLLLHRLPERGAFIGKWNVEFSDPLPELIVVRDEDYEDTLAWLASYFTTLAPITQWCRVISFSQLSDLAHHTGEVTLRNRLGSWVGAILAECHAQSQTAVNLKDIPGTAALSTATYAAGRYSAIWQDKADYRQLAKRHDDMAAGLRDGARLLMAHELVQVWNVISGTSKSEMDNRPLRDLRSLFDRAASFQSRDPSELISDLLDEARDSFRMPELAELAKGTQADRVRVLDRIATKLVSGPKSSSLDGILGFAACLVDPGAAVLPELLRKYTAIFPLAPVWLGAFAGAISPSRVFAEHGGLGRIISKSLLMRPDFDVRPQSDAGYDEIIRWVSPKSSQPISLRGMSSRTLNVELILGVTCSFSLGRPEQTGQREVQKTNVEINRYKTVSTKPTNTNADVGFMQTILRRVEAIEQKLAQTGSDFLPGLDLNQEDNTARRNQTKPKSRK